MNKLDYIKIENFSSLNKIINHSPLKGPRTPWRES